MNVEELLELMEETLEEGTAVPFSPSKRIVDVDRMRDIIDEVRNNLPDEIRDSKKIVADREQIIKGARAESENIIKQAEERARGLVSDQEITKRAQQRAVGAMAPPGLRERAVQQNGRAGRFPAQHGARYQPDFHRARRVRAGRPCHDGSNYVKQSHVPPPSCKV